jgi:hypothetical protein
MTARSFEGNFTLLNGSLESPGPNGIYAIEDSCSHDVEAAARLRRRRLLQLFPGHARVSVEQAARRPLADTDRSELKK